MASKTVGIALAAAVAGTLELGGLWLPTAEATESAESALGFDDRTDSPTTAPADVQQKLEEAITQWPRASARGYESVRYADAGVAEPKSDTLAPDERGELPAGAIRVIESVKRPSQDEQGPRSAGAGRAATPSEDTFAPDERGDPPADTVQVGAEQATSVSPRPLRSEPASTAGRSRRDALKIGEVHFNPGSAQLTPGGLQILKAVVARISSEPEKRIRVVAFTDTTGGSDLNQRLSFERALAISDQLKLAGIEDRFIELVASGEHNSPIRTEDEVSEPLNRCAGIFLVDQ